MFLNEIKLDAIVLGKVRNEVFIVLDKVLTIIEVLVMVTTAELVGLVVIVLGVSLNSFDDEL